jgi:hypothetical protein
MPRSGSRRLAPLPVEHLADLPASVGLAPGIEVTARCGLESAAALIPTCGPQTHAAPILGPWTGLALVVLLAGAGAHASAQPRNGKSLVGNKG